MRARVRSLIAACPAARFGRTLLSLNFRLPKEHAVSSTETSNTWLAPRAGRRLLTYVPANAETERRVEQLVGMDSCS